MSQKAKKAALPLKTAKALECKDGQVLKVCEMIGAGNGYAMPTVVVREYCYNDARPRSSRKTA